MTQRPICPETLAGSFSPQSLLNPFTKLLPCLCSPVMFKTLLDAWTGPEFLWPGKHLSSPHHWLLRITSAL